MDGEAISHYRLLEKLGSGGMGVVYSAQDVRLGRQVALKFVSAKYSHDSAALRRFEREARAASALNHPNICTIHEIDVFEGRHFIAMELLKGTTLSDRIAGSPLPLEEAVEYAIQIASALEAAHGEGIIHRDIKPANIFVTSQGRVKLLDFGLAKLNSAPGNEIADTTGSTVTDAKIPDIYVTIPGALIGTVAYMSPEQAQGEQLDVCTDLFSFGTVLYEMVTGRPPFTGGSQAAVRDSILHKQPQSLHASRGRSQGLVHIIDKTLQKDRSLRYQTASDLRSDLMQLKRELEWRRTASRESPSIEIRRMIAILPFENLSQSSEHDYFVDGLTEEMITQLGRMNPRRLGVIARTSAMKYKNTKLPISQIAKALGVNYVLSGSVRRAGNRVRIAAQLIQVRDQSHLWADTYDRQLKDLIGIQVDVAEQIAKSLRLELIPEQQSLIARSSTANVEAYELYLQGRFLWNKRTPDAVVMAIERFEKAAAADSSYAMAHVGLADCYAVLGFYGALPAKDSYGKAFAYADKALELDWQLAEAHCTRAFCLLQHDWDWPRAEHEHLLAIELNPNCASVHHWYGIDLTQMGRFAEAQSSLQRAIELDPFQVDIRAHMGRLLYFSRDYARSLDELRKAVKLDPAYAPARYFLAMCLLQTSDRNDAIAELEKLVREFPQQPVVVSGLARALGVSARLAEARRVADTLKSFSGRGRIPQFLLAFALACPGNENEVLCLLEAAYCERFSWLLYLPIEPVFDFLRNDPRFHDLAKRVRALVTRSPSA